MREKITSGMQAVGVVLITVGIGSFSVPIGIIVLGAALLLIGGLA